MLKFILTMLLVILSRSAIAEWVQVGNNEANNFRYYVESPTTSIFSNKVKMRDMKDFTFPHTTTDGKKFLSVKVQREYDCKNAKDRMIGVSMHSGNMGEGVVLLSKSGKGQWEPSHSIPYLKIACKIK